MPPLEQSSEQIPQVAPSKLDAIVALSPDLGDQIHRYNKQISQLSDEQQRDLMERWKVEVQNGGANIGVFSSIVRNIRIQGISTKEFAVETKEFAVETKEFAVETKEFAVETKDVALETIKTKENNGEIKENKIRYEEAIAAAGTAKEIGLRIGGKYTSEIKKKSSEDFQKPETQKYLATLGIEDVNNIPNDKKQVVQDILMARATTQVLLDNQKQILAENPKFGEDIKTLNSLRFTLGLSDSAKAIYIGNLLTDQPKSDREAITSTVKTLTKDSPDTMITRTGDRLTFSDPKNERYTYDIDMAKRPLELSKQLSGLTISRELGETRDPAREENKKTRDNVDRLVTGINLKKNEILNGTLKDGTKIISEGFSESEGFGGSIKNTISQIKLGTVEAAGTSQIMIEAGLVSINSEKKRLEQLIKDKTGKDNLNSDLDSDIGAIRGTLRGIDTMIESFNKLKDECKKIQKEDPKNDHTQWENNTNRTLRDLVSLGFDELGQKNLNTLIKTISEQNGNRGIWEGGKLDITGKKLDQQLVYLEKFVGNLREKSGKNERETFQELRVRIASFADFRKDRWESGTFIAGFLPNKDNNNSTVTAQNTSGESMKKPL